MNTSPIKKASNKDKATRQIEIMTTQLCYVGLIESSSGHKVCLVAVDPVRFSPESEREKEAKRMIEKYFNDSDVKINRVYRLDEIIIPIVAGL